MPFTWCAGTWQVYLRRERLFRKTVWLRGPVLSPIGERGDRKWVESSPCPSYVPRSYEKEGTKKQTKYIPPRSFKVAFLLGRLELLLVKQIISTHSTLGPRVEVQPD